MKYWQNKYMYNILTFLCKNILVLGRIWAFWERSVHRLDCLRTLNLEVKNVKASTDRRWRTNLFLTSRSKEEPDLLGVLAERTVTYKHSIRRLVRAVNCTSTPLTGSHLTGTQAWRAEGDVLCPNEGGEGTCKLRKESVKDWQPLCLPWPGDCWQSHRPELYLHWQEVLGMDISPDKVCNNHVKIVAEVDHHITSLSLKGQKLLPSLQVQCNLAAKQWDWPRRKYLNQIIAG